MDFLSKLFGKKQPSTPRSDQPSRPKLSSVEQPKFILKRQTPSGTYEVYQGVNAESARSFLNSKIVDKRQYYIKVKTPECNWGVDIDGLYLEQLAPFQLDINSAQCEGSICGMPAASSLQSAANRLADNFVVRVKCGKCNHEWEDGVRYKNMAVVRCSNCNILNKVDSSPHIQKIHGMLVFTTKI